ncbi:MAG TPA: hypothetical protein VJQ46_10480 [Gemmatimonadales bacterium]|nr:hypothetical protein [Gemmatimonadales bacterium]
MTAGSTTHSPPTGYAAAARLARTLLLPFALAATAACNDLDPNQPARSTGVTDPTTELAKRPARIVRLIVTPDTATVASGAMRSFSAVGVRRDGSQVPVTPTWTATGGTVDTAGTFKAGATAGAYRVIGSLQSGGLADTSRVTIVGASTTPTLASVSLTPATVTLSAGGTQQFTARGTWSDGSTTTLTPGYDVTGGTISSAGMYTAGQTAGTFRVIATAPGTTLADTSAVTITSVTPPPVNTASCFDRGPATMTVSGTQSSRLDNRTGLAANAIIDARTAYWPQVDDYPVLVGGGNGWCWTGGRIEGFWSDQTTWSDMHGRTAFEDYGGANTVLEALYLRNYGDGLTIRITADNWTLRRSHFVHMRDDCIENDYERGGLVDDVLFEGCYSGFSARPSDSKLGTYSGANNVWTIQNSLVWLEPMAQPYKGTPPNTSGFFKWDKSSYNSSPQLVLRNNIFRADMTPADGTLCLAPPGKVAESVNNVIVWLGAGTYPCLPLPPGWTLTTDRSVWDNAVTAWKAAHPGL